MKKNEKMSGILEYYNWLIQRRFVEACEMPEGATREDWILPTSPGNDSTLLTPWRNWRISQRYKLFKRLYSEM